MNEPETIEVGTFEAKNKLSALVEMAAGGKRIWITKHGVRMALLSCGLEGSRQTEPDLIGAFRKLRSASSSGETPIKDWIEEGRK